MDDSIGGDGPRHAATREPHSEQQDTAGETSIRSINVPRPYDMNGPLIINLAAGVDAGIALKALGLREADGGALGEADAGWEFDVDWDDDDEVENLSDPTTRYGDRSIVAEFWYHSDGSGPFSSEGSGALLALGEYWVTVSGGDSGEPDRIELASGDKAQYVLDWLTRAGALPALIVKQTPAAWDDSELAERLAEAIDSVMGYTIDVVVNLSKTDMVALLDHIDSGEHEDRELRAVLRDVNHPFAQPLLDLLENCADEESAGALVRTEGFVRDLAAGPGFSHQRREGEVS